MSKYRIYELAKEFNTESKVIIDILARNNMEAKNHMSSVGDDAKTVITRTFAHKMTTSANNVAPSVQIPQQQSVQTTPTMTNTPPQTRPAYNNQNNLSQNQTPRPAYNNQQNPRQNQSPRPAYNNQQNVGTQPSSQARPAAANKFAHSTNKPPANANNSGFRNQGSGNFNRRPQQNNNNNRHNQFRAAQAPKVEIPKPKNIKLGESISVKDLASKMSMQVGEVIKILTLIQPH